MAFDIKQVSRRMLEDVFGEGELDYLDEVCDENYVGHDPLTGESDIDSLKENVRMYRAAFPDMKPTILSSVAEGDTVCTRWRMSGTHQNPIFGVQPSGKRVTVEGITLSRFRGGKLAETFVQWNTFSFLQQLGVIPGLEALTGGRAAEGRQPHL